MFKREKRKEKHKLLSTSCGWCFVVFYGKQTQWIKSLQQALNWGEAEREKDRNELPFVAFTREITCINYDCFCLHTSKQKFVLILWDDVKHKEKPLLWMDEKFNPREPFSENLTFHIQ
jgi:hypothetical protein